MFKRHRRCKLFGIVFLLLLLIRALEVHERLWNSKSYTKGSSISSLLHLNRQETPLIEDEHNSQLAEIQIDGTVDMGHRFLERKHTVQDACAETKAQQKYEKCEENTMKNNVFYVKEHDLVFCTIQKAGSTFWRRLLHVAGGWGNVSNPLHLGVGRAYSNKGGFTSMKGLTLTEIQAIFESSKSIMFVRDPLSKLFSGWLDKLYSPNVPYWKMIGDKIVKTRRPSKVNQTSQCGFDIDFAEFVNYTTASILKKPCINSHFAPNHKHCLPCNFTYDYIGKYETFMEDTLYLINAFNLSDKVKFDDFEKDADLDAIKNAANWVFSQRKGVMKCNVTFACALFRVWERLRSRGLIGIEVQFPYSTKQLADNVTKLEFEDVLLKAYQQSNAENLKQNRKLALQQAFTDLPNEVVNQIESAFGLDFKLFDYNIGSYHGVSEKTDFIYSQPCPVQLL